MIVVTCFAYDMKLRNAQDRRRRRRGTLPSVSGDCLVTRVDTKHGKREDLPVRRRLR